MARKQTSVTRKRATSKSASSTRRGNPRSRSKTKAAAPSVRKKAARKIAAPAAKAARRAPARAGSRTTSTRPRPSGAAVRGAIVPASPSRDAPHWTETLSDGTHVIIRPIHKEDVALERAFIKRLSPESRRLRFLGQINEPSDELVKSLTDIDYRRDVAFVALVHREGEKREVGVARYGTSEDGKSCECAVTVADEWRHRGLGTILMRHLIDVARSRGIRSMFSVDAAANNEMRDLAKFLGFSRKRDPDDPTEVIHTLALE